MWGACLGAALVILTRDYLGGMLAGRGPLLLGILFGVAIGLGGSLVSVGRHLRNV